MKLRRQRSWVLSRLEFEVKRAVPPFHRMILVSSDKASLIHSIDLYLPQDKSLILLLPVLNSCLITVLRSPLSFAPTTYIDNHSTISLQIMENSSSYNSNQIGTSASQQHPSPSSASQTARTWLFSPLALALISQDTLVVGLGSA